MPDSTKATRQPTPKHLWIVGVLSLLWNAMGAFDYLMTQLRNEAHLSKCTPEMLAYIENIPMWAESTWAFAVWGGLVGSVLLLLRIRWAGLAFVISAVAMIATTFYSYGIANGMEVMGDAGSLILAGAIFVIAIALVVYTRAMCTRKIIV